VCGGNGGGTRCGATGRFVARDSEGLGFRPFGGLRAGVEGMGTGVGRDGDIKSKIREKRENLRPFLVDGVWKGDIIWGSSRVLNTRGGNQRAAICCVE
jgi:hypothetical protein